MSNIVIDAFKSHAAGALRGFCDVTMPSGMRLHGCCLFTKGGRAWMQPPAKKLGERYEAVVSFVDRATGDKWSEAVIEALRAAHPEALT